MGARSFTSVLRSFYETVEGELSFLIDEGMAGPRRDTEVMPTVSYARPSLGYDISLDVREGKIVTTGWRNDGDLPQSANLEALVEASGLAPRQTVSLSAQSRFALTKSAASQASWVRRVHPLLTGDDGLDLVRRASEIA